MELGNLIKEARLKKRLKAMDLAAKLSTSSTMISRWEHDKGVPSPSDLGQICKHLDVDEKLAFTLWARSQMPSKDLKAHFSAGPRFAPYTSKTPDMPASSTFIISARDIPWFEKHPSAHMILTRGLMASLKGEAWTLRKLTTGLPCTAKEARAIVEHLLRIRFLVRKGKGYATPEGIKNVYTPETDEFKNMRRDRYRIIFDVLSKNFVMDKMPPDGPAFLRVYQEHMSETEVTHFMNLVRALYAEFVNYEVKSDETSESYYLLVGFGKEFPND